MEFYLIRHGETDWNLQKKLQGHTDVPLNANGQKQAEGLREKLLKLQINRIFSSDLSRARQTAEIATHKAQVLISYHSELREVHFGLAEGLTREEISAQWSLEEGYPQGESQQSADRRFHQFMQQQLQSLVTTPQAKVAFVTHGLLIRTYLQLRFGKKAENLMIQNCGLCKMQFVQNQILFDCYLDRQNTVT